MTQGWLRSSQNTSATSVRAAAPNSTQQPCSNFTPWVRMAAQAGGKSPGQGEERGKEQAGGRKAPDLSKFQPPLATLASLIKHFHLQRNQPIQSSEKRSSPGPPGMELQPHRPCRGALPDPRGREPPINPLDMEQELKHSLAEKGQCRGGICTLNTTRGRASPRSRLGSQGLSRTHAGVHCSGKV